MTAHSFTILLLGDFHYGESYRQAGARVLAEHGYRHSTEHLRPFVEAADVRVFNLETPVVDPTKFPSPLRGAKTYLHWADPQQTPAALRELGVDAVSLANNHTLDHGPEGLAESLTHLDAVGITTFGAGLTLAEAQRPYSITVPATNGGGEVQIFGSFQYSRRHDLDYRFYAQDATPGCAPLSQDSLDPWRAPTDRDDLFTIAFPHWGANYQWRNRTQTDLGQSLVRSGHDLVLGHGSHCIQEIDRVDDRWIVNSLGNGNFQSGGRFARYVAEQAILPFGFWAMLEISGSTLTERAITLKLYPVHSDNKATNYQPGPVSQHDFERTVERLTQRSTVSLDPADPAMTSGSDDLGHFIALDLGPSSRSSSPTSRSSSLSRHVDPAAREGRVYADPQTRDILDQYGSGRNLGAILNANAASRSGARVEWMDPSTAIAHFSDRRILINGYKCDESDLGSRIVQDKYLMKHFLRQQGVSTPEGELARSPEQAVEIAQRLARPVVVKPRSGNKGRGITVNIATPEQIHAAYVRAAKVGKHILVEEYIPAHREYRALATEQDCVSVVRRILPNVTGTGRSTLRELIQVKNDERTLNPALIRRYIPIDDVTRAYLARHGHTLDDIVPAGQTITVRDVGGLSSGGEPQECSDDVDDALKQTAIQAIGAIPGLTWGGSDIIVAETTGQPYVIEINSDADIGGATFPLAGEPKDVAGHMISLRLASSSAEVFGRAGATAPALSPAPSPAPSKPIAALRRILTRSTPNSTKRAPAIPGPLADGFFAWLTAQGHTVTREGSSIVKVQTRDGAVVHCTAEAMTGQDLSAVRRVMRRHGLVRKFLAAADLPRVAGRRVVNRGQLARFTEDHPGAQTLLPYRAEWGGPRTTVIAEPTEVEPTVLAGAPAWFVQRCRRGTRLRILATPDRALALLGPNDAPVSGSTEQSVGELAVRAVRAVPQLRWAAVDVVVHGDSSRRALVEGMCVNPVVAPGWAVVGGSLEAAFAMIASGIVDDARG